MCGDLFLFTHLTIEVSVFIYLHACATTQLNNVWAKEHRLS